MAITPLPQSDRFFAPGITKALFLPAIAKASVASSDPTYLVPTSSELNAATDLSDEINDWSGWSLSSNFIDTPDLGSRFTGTVAGRITAEASSITFYADRTGADVRTVLPRDTKGFIVIADGGIGVGKKADIFPVTVGSVGRTRPLDNGATVLPVNFSIRRQPAQDVVLPA